jgi:hypothetical protein
MNRGFRKTGTGTGYIAICETSMGKTKSRRLAKKYKKYDISPFTK